MGKVGVERVMEEERALEELESRAQSGKGRARPTSQYSLAYAAPATHDLYYPDQLSERVIL